MRLTHLLAKSQSSCSSSSGNRAGNPFCMQGRYDFGCQIQERCLHSEWMISSLVLSPKDEGHIRWFAIALYWQLWAVLSNIPAYILMEKITFSLLDILCSSLYCCQKVFVHKRQQLDINIFFSSCMHSHKMRGALKIGSAYIQRTTRGHHISLCISTNGFNF